MQSCPFSKSSKKIGVCYLLAGIHFFHAHRNLSSKCLLLLQKLKESEEGGVSEENFRKEDDFAASFRLRSSLQDAIMAERYFPCLIINCND